MDQRIALTDRIVAAINELREETKKVKIAIKFLSTYSGSPFTFGGAAIVNSAGVAAVTGLASNTIDLVGLVAEVASVSGTIEMESELASSAAAITAGASAGLDLVSDIIGSAAGDSGSTGDLDSQQCLISSIAEVSDSSCIRLNTVRLGGSCDAVAANTGAVDAQQELIGVADSVSSATGSMGS